MIIWDTGEYEILPYQPEQTQPETDDSRSDILSDTSISTVDSTTESEKLRQAFQNVCSQPTILRKKKKKKKRKKERKETLPIFPSP